MRILLITPSYAGGHHEEYKKFLIMAFKELGHEVLNFSDNNVKAIKINQSKPARAEKSKCFSNIFFKYHKYSTVIWQIRHKTLADWINILNYLQVLENISKSPDLIFFECLDSYVGHYLIKRDVEKKLVVPFSGILLSPSDTHSLTRSSFRKGLFDPYQVLKSRLCISVGVLTDGAVPMLSNLIKKPVIELPDIISKPESIQDHPISELIRSHAGNRFIIGIWGSLEQRKGIADFLHICLKLPSEKYFFVMGGQIQYDGWLEKDLDMLKQCSSRSNENILIVDRWLSDDELLSGMINCDLIYAAYHGWKFSSGIVGKAAAIRVPILVNDGFVMAKRVKEFNLGFVKQEQADISKWVSEHIAEIRKLRSSFLFKEGCLKYCERYGYEQWCKSIAQLIDPT